MPPIGAVALGRTEGFARLLDEQRRREAVGAEHLAAVIREERQHGIQNPERPAGLAVTASHRHGRTLFPWVPSAVLDQSPTQDLLGCRLRTAGWQRTCAVSSIQSVSGRTDGGISRIRAVYRGPPIVWNLDDPCTRLRFRNGFHDHARLPMWRSVGALDHRRSGVPGHNRFPVALDEQLTWGPRNGPQAPMTLGAPQQSRGAPR
jgi:hypothetical protein